MKRAVAAVAVVLAGSLMADSVDPIGWRQTGGVNVGEGETSNVTSRLVIADKGTFVKTGEGTLNLPIGALDKSGTQASYAILDGQANLTDAAVATGALTVPSVIVEKAALWISAASESDSSITMSGENVVNWYDARETGVGEAGFVPKYPYMAHACVSGKTDLQQVKKAYLGHNAVWFGGINAKGKGGYMRLKDAAGNDAAFQFAFNVFFVHGIETAMGTVIGHVTNPSDFMMDAGSLVSLDHVSYYYYRGDFCAGALTARHYRNGVVFDPFHTAVRPTYELIEADFVDSPAAVSTLYNNRNSSDRQGGDYLSEAIVFTNRLTEVERLSVQRYLLAKWELANGVSCKTEMGVAAPATVSMAVSATMGATNHYPLAFRGEGKVETSGSGRFVVGPGMFADFNGIFDFGCGSLFSRFDELPAFVAKDGTVYTAALQHGAYKDIENGMVLTQAAGTAGRIVKNGIGDAAFTSIPATTHRLAVNAGTLGLVGRKAEREYVAGGAIRAVFPNANAEAVQIDTPSSNRRRHPITSGKTLNGWTFVGTGGFTGGFLVGPLMTDDGKDWQFEIQEGRQALYIFSNDGKQDGYGDLYTVGTFPAAGEYLVSWQETRYDESKISAYEVRFGKTWSDAEAVETRVAASGFYPRVYMRLSVPEAGEYCFGFRLLKDVGYVALTVDDLRADFVAKPNRSKVSKIPNGDFEQITTDGKTLSWQYSDSLHAANRPLGWEVYNGDGWEETVRKPVVGIAALDVPFRSVNQRNNNNNNSRFTRLADESYGTFQLFMCGSPTYGDNHYARTTFTVAEPGVYCLRGKVSRWNISYLDVDYFGGKGELSKVNAKVTVGGTECDLGDLVGDTHLQVDRIWPGGTFTVTEPNTEVTLTLRQTVAKAACLVDDLVLVETGSPVLADDGELVVNGSFENHGTVGEKGSVNDVEKWSTARNPDVTSQTISYWWPKGDGLQYTAAPYDGNVVCCVRGASSLSQPLPVMTAGRYRFRVAANTRWTGGYDENGIRVTLNDAEGNVKYTVFEIDAVTNYEAKVYSAYVDVTDEGRYTLKITGTHADLRTGDRACVIDGVSLKREYGEKLPPSVPSDLHITVAEGAKLNLDYTGTVKTGSVRLGNRSVAGVIDAETYPEYVTGTGSIEANPCGSVIIFR